MKSSQQFVLKSDCLLLAECRARGLQQQAEPLLPTIHPASVTGQKPLAPVPKSRLDAGCRTEEASLQFFRIELPVHDHNKLGVPRMEHHLKRLP